MQLRLVAFVSLAHVAATYQRAAQMKKLWLGITSAALVAISAFSAVFSQAGNYPDKSVTIISDSAPGSAPDVDARFLSDAFTRMWGQQVIVVNHPGAAATGFSRMVERAGIAAKLGIKVHAHMLRHACGYKLANDKSFN